MAKRKGYYDKTFQETGDRQTTFVGVKTVRRDVRSGYVVEPYDDYTQHSVRVTLPAKSRTNKWPDTVAEVNWSGMGARDPDLALEYARLITRAAKYAQAKQAEFDKNKEVAT